MRSILASPSESEDLPTWMIEKFQVFFKYRLKEPSTTRTQNVGEQKENGVSTPHVLKLRPYAHIKAKHAKKNFKSTHVILPFQKHNAMSSKSYQVHIDPSYRKVT